MRKRAHSENSENMDMLRTELCPFNCDKHALDVVFFFFFLIRIFNQTKNKQVLVYIQCLVACYHAMQDYI